MLDASGGLKVEIAGANFDAAAPFLALRVMSSP